MTPEELACAKADREKYFQRLAYLATDAGLNEMLEALRVVLGDECPMCGEGQREVAGLSHLFGDSLISSTPAAVVRCVRCGLITQHCVFKLRLAEMPLPYTDTDTDQAAESIFDVLFSKTK